MKKITVKTLLGTQIPIEVDPERDTVEDIQRALLRKSISHQNFTNLFQKESHLLPKG
jgi:hypothetical protein